MTSLRSNLKSIGTKTDEVRTRTAESLESAAESLDSTATRIRPGSGSRVLGGVRSSVRRNPMGSLALATAFGLVAGFTCRASLR